MRRWYARWLALRRAHPALGARHKDRTRATLDEGGAVLTLTRSAPSGERVVLVANLTAAARPWMAPPGWAVLLDSDAAEFGGRGSADTLQPWQALLCEPARC